MPSKILLQPNLTCNGILFKNILCREALKINFKQLNVFRAPNSKSKTQSQKILVSVFLGLLTGLYTNSMAYAFSDQSSDMTWFYLLTQLGVMLHITITWLTPLVIIQILLTYLNGKCNSAKVNLFEECKECLDIHNSFSISFRLFFFVYCQAQVRSPKSKVPKSRPKGLGLTIKSHGPPTPPTPPTHL